MQKKQFCWPSAVSVIILATAVSHSFSHLRDNFEAQHPVGKSFLEIANSLSGWYIWTCRWNCAQFDDPIFCRWFLLELPRNSPSMIKVHLFRVWYYVIQKLKEDWMRVYQSSSKTQGDTALLKDGALCKMALFDYSVIIEIQPTSCRIDMSDYYCEPYGDSKHFKIISLYLKGLITFVNVVGNLLL